jgi:hypothetical protein
MIYKKYRDICVPSSFWRVKDWASTQNHKRTWRRQTGGIGGSFQKISKLWVIRLIYSPSWRHPPRHRLLRRNDAITVYSFYPHHVKDTISIVVLVSHQWRALTLARNKTVLTTPTTTVIVGETKNTQHSTRNSTLFLRRLRLVFRFEKSGTTFTCSDDCNRLAWCWTFCVTNEWR